MLDFIAAFFTAALSATGVGGGGLLILYLRLVRDMPQVSAQGINLIFFSVSSACASAVHFFRRRLCFRIIILCGLCGFAGAFLGFAVMRAVNTALLSKIFGALIALCGIKTFFSKKSE